MKHTVGKFFLPLCQPHGGYVLVDMDFVAVEHGQNEAKEPGGWWVRQKRPFALGLKPIPKTTFGTFHLHNFQEMDYNYL